MRISLIDADILCFQASAIKYEYIDLGTKIIYRYKRDLPKGVDFERRELPKSLETCISILEQSIARVLRDTEADAYICYLTPSRTFRHDVAVTREYKGNRTGKDRPRHLNAVRQHVTDVYDGIMGNYIEADDSMSIAQAHFRDVEDVCTVICSSDKDLLMNEGYHYNLTTRANRFITKEEGYIIYARQILTGDLQVDCIQGIHGIGKVKAAKLIPDDVEEITIFQILEDQYEKAYGDDWEVRLEEVHQLIYMRTTPYHKDDPTDYFKYKLCEKQYKQGEF